MRESAEASLGQRAPRPAIAADLLRRAVLRAAARGALPLGLLALLVLGILVSLGVGAVDVGLARVVEVLYAADESAASRIVRDIRLPRALLAVLVGMNLAGSGTLLQGVMRNPLAAPSIVGVTAGAGLAATATLVLFPTAARALPIAAFAGAMAATVVVYGISWRPGSGTSPVRLVLAGVAVNVMLGAFTSFLMVAFNDQVQQVVLWMSGSLASAAWEKVELILPYSVIGALGGLLMLRALNALQLGEEVATGLGVGVERARLLVIAAASLLAGAAVSVAGLVGFVGLVVPHILRMIVGSHHGRLLPAALLGGAALMVWADLAARTVVAPTELPVGILTAMIGGPYFIFLLYRSKLL